MPLHGASQTNEQSTVALHTSHVFIRMAVDEESEWDHLNRTNWRGLGLTDPIKSIEVRSLLSLLENVI
jgi:hypothetical protein